MILPSLCPYDQTKAGKKAAERYEEVAGAKINFYKSEGLWLGAWRGGISLPDPSASLGCGSGLASNWSKIG